MSLLHHYGVRRGHSLIGREATHIRSILVISATWIAAHAHSIGRDVRIDTSGGTHTTVHVRLNENENIRNDKPKQDCIQYTAQCIQVHAQTKHTKYNVVTVNMFCIHKKDGSNDTGLTECNHGDTTTTPECTKYTTLQPNLQTKGIHGTHNTQTRKLIYQLREKQLFLESIYITDSLGQGPAN